MLTGPLTHTWGPQCICAACPEGPDPCMGQAEQRARLLAAAVVGAHLVLDLVHHGLGLAGARGRGKLHKAVALQCAWGVAVPVLPAPWVGSGCGVCLCSGWVVPEVIRSTVSCSSQDEA